MPVVTSYTLNTFCFPGFCSGDSGTCKKFYSDVLNWTPVDVDTPDGAYTSFRYNGEIVAGMYQMPDERKAAGVRPHWNSYLLVEDVDATVQRAEELGGKVYTPPFDAMGDRMANLEDPDGARFSVYESRTKSEPMLINDIGGFCWSELYARRPDEMSRFYSQLLGWQPQPFEGSPMPYTTFNLSNGEPAMVGMLQLCDEMKEDKAHWMPYFMVEDVDATLARATRAGGQTHGPMDVPGAGRLGFIADAEGAGFGIIKPSPR